MRRDKPGPLRGRRAFEQSRISCVLPPCHPPLSRGERGGCTGHTKGKNALEKCSARGSGCMGRAERGCIRLVPVATRAGIRFGLSGHATGHRDDPCSGPRGAKVPEAIRNPMLSLRLSGVFLLRFAARQFLGLLFHEPPRRTRQAQPDPFTNLRPPNRRRRNPKALAVAA